MRKFLILRNLCSECSNILQFSIVKQFLNISGFSWNFRSSCVVQTHACLQEIFFSNAMFRSCDFPKHSLSFLVPYSSFLNYTQVLSFSEYILLSLLNHFLPFRHNQVLHKQLACLSVRSRKKLIRFCDLHIMDLIFYEQ